MRAVRKQKSRARGRRGVQAGPYRLPSRLPSMWSATQGRRASAPDD
ncbi:hypothetical protein MBEBAB_1111 [Brevundimonas abyssalis TAR-001]|uniref:Uncharacterized protein n=1 Tax=Brevundimonas abyssalis TAR-001 TaxID=1391729 RepID=A0A8E0NAV3_9CAUL|nr:hypothetical protein MBEBAB_1111 [Brevundimonas abyssalis TAR-001]